MNVNTEEYWDSRFKSDWDTLDGDKQSVFFAKIAQTLIPKWLKDEINDKNLTVLDWGCAEGDGTNVLSKTIFPNIEGMDFSDTAIKVASKRYPKVVFRSLNILEKNDFNKGYDIFFASNVFEHFDDPWALFNKIEIHARKYIVLLIPYKEGWDKLIDEHYYSFDQTNIPKEIKEWQLRSVSVIDTSSIEETAWNGNQALLIFSKQATQINPETNLDNVIDRIREEKKDYHEEIDKYKKSIIELQNKIEYLEEKNVEKDKEVYKYWLMTESTRYKFISKFADFAYRIFPANSYRRRLVKFIFRVLKLPYQAYVSVKNYQSIKQKRIQRKTIRQNALRCNSLVVYVTMPWKHHLKQRPHHLMKEIANQDVFAVYVDETIDSPIFVNQNLVVLPKKDWQFYIDNLTKKMSCYYMTAAHYPISFEEIKVIENRGYKLIYEYIDDLDEAIFGNLDKQIEVFNRLEDLDPVLIIASARRLYDQMTKIFPDGRVILNENAVNTEHFRPKKRIKSKSPKDLRELTDTGKPIVGYYGAIAPWLDYELILQAVEARGEYNFVFIGPDYHGGMEKMPEKENIFTLGPKSYDELPDYSNWFDCAIIPFEEGDIAKATSPVKLFEYMSMGIPTVCTKDLNECRGYEGVIVAKSREDFISSIDKAITYHSSKSVRAKLEEYAHKNTWEARAVDIVENLKKIEGKA